MIHINSYKLTPAITATWGDITGNVSNQEDLVEYISTHGGGNAAWGSISGNISDQTDLMSTLGSYATESWVSSQQFVTESWVSEQGYLVSDDLSQYATRQWVTGRGYATESWVSEQGYLTSVPSEYATQSWVSGQGYITSESLSGYATESWVSEQGYLTSSALTGYATEQWVSSQQFATQSWVAGQGYLTHVPPFYATVTWVERQGYLTSSALTGYATESWVSSQGYVNNSQVVSIFNDCNPLVYDMSNPLTYLESHSVLKYDMTSDDHSTNPLVLGYWVNGPQSSTISEYTTIIVEGGEFIKRAYSVHFDSSTGQVTEMEENYSLYPYWLANNECPLINVDPEEETGSPTDYGVVRVDNYGDYGILIGANPTGVDGEFEGLRIDPEGVIGKYVVTGEEDEETGEMTYTDEMYPFATESWVTEQITNSIGSAMSITNQILS